VAATRRLVRRTEYIPTGQIQPALLAAASEWVHFYEQLGSQNLNALDAALKAKRAAQQLQSRKDTRDDRRKLEACG